MAEFFGMEGYAFYVWWSYAAMAVVLTALTALYLWRNARVRAELVELERRVGRATGAGDAAGRR